ncbi:hypothetical protein [Hymenobacter negativus]|nr:hypothetical protein [Hymenobacter negativus]
MTRKEWLFFGLACCIKLGLAFLIHPSYSGGSAAGGVFAVRGGDTFSYLDPVENLFRHGIYAQDLSRLETYAGRMPGYGVVYGALRLVWGPGGAADGVVLLQLVLSLWALYCLGRLAQQATQRSAAFQWTVLLYAANTFTTVFDIRLLSESFAISALIIGVHAFCQGQRPAPAGAVLRIGCWLAWMVFLRPFLAPLLGLLAGWYVLRPLVEAGGRGPGLRQGLLRGALLLLPFLVADGAWVARNWPWYHHLVPLQSNTWAGYKTAPALNELNEFMGAIGEEHAWWRPDTDMAWFYKPATDSSPNFRGEAGKIAPPAFTYDSLVLVRRYLGVAQDSTLPPAPRQVAEARARRALVAYKQAFQRTRPMRAFVLVPFKLAYGLLFAHPGDYLFPAPFAQLPPWQKGLKILVHLWYLALVALGLAGTLLLGWRPNFAALIVKIVPLYLIGLFCLIIHLVDARYFAIAYPFVLISAVDLLLTVKGAIENRRRAVRLKRV